MPFDMTEADCQIAHYKLATILSNSIGWCYHLPFTSVFEMDYYYYHKQHKYKS